MTETIIVKPTLYKKTTTGATQIWFQEINQTGDSFRTVSGQIDGEKVTSAWTRCESKNVGRSNETTPQQQCELEVEANYTKKLAQGGYHEKIEDIDKAKYFKPMLAQDYNDYIPTGIAYRREIVFSQPKLDGIRCVLDAEGMWSRNGKPIISAPHIWESLQAMFEEFPDLRLDGELYTDRLSDDFNRIVSMAKKSKPTASDLLSSREYLRYWIYDLPSHEGTFEERFARLREMFDEFVNLNGFCVLVPTIKVQDEDHLDRVYAEYMESGMEGQMVRISENPYENKRTKQLLKRKEFKTEEFRIVRIEEGIGNRSGMAGRIVCAWPDGREFDSGIKGTHEYCKLLLEQADRYVDGDVTVKYQNLTPDGVPRFPVAVALYEGKRDL